MLRAPGPSAEAGTGAARAAPAPEVIVHRPDAGLARGVWEAPPWAFMVMAAAVAAALVLYVAHRRGKLKLPWKTKGGGPQGGTPK